MKVRQIVLDEDGEPTAVLVAMSVKEAALIARMTGQHSPSTMTDALGYGWFEVSSSIFDGLTGELFNRFWDAGVDEVIPRWTGE